MLCGSVAQNQLLCLPSVKSLGWFRHKLPEGKSSGLIETWGASLKMIFLCTTTPVGCFASTGDDIYWGFHNAVQKPHQATSCTESRIKFDFMGWFVHFYQISYFGPSLEWWWKSSRCGKNLEPTQFAPPPPPSYSAYELLPIVSRVLKSSRGQDNYGIMDGWLNSSPSWWKQRGRMSKQRATSPPGQQSTTWESTFCLPQTVFRLLDHFIRDNQVVSAVSLNQEQTVSWTTHYDETFRKLSLDVQLTKVWRLSNSKWLPLSTDRTKHKNLVKCKNFRVHLLCRCECKHISRQCFMK